MRVLVVGVLLAIGCAPRIKIEWNRPPRLSVPKGQPLALNVQADGTPPNANMVADAIIDITQGQVLNKWMAVGPVRHELDAQLRAAGHNMVEGPGGGLTVRVRPTRWSYHANKSGSGSGRLEARIEVFDDRDPGGQPKFADSYWGSGGGGNIGEPEAMARCARGIARAFIATLQPSRVVAKVELDDSDPITQPGIELCRDGQFEAAYLAFSEAATRAPKSAPVLYNLAVLAEARGEYDLAESMLTRAVSEDSKSLYFVALERVRRARKDTQ